MTVPIRIEKAKESMLAAIQCFNNPFARYRAETYLQLALVAWTHLLHEKLEKANINIAKNNRYLSLCECIKKPESETGLSSQQTNLLNDLIKLRNDIVHNGSKTKALSKEYSKLTKCALYFETYLESFGAELKLGDIPFYAISLTGIQDMDEDTFNNLIASASTGGKKATESGEKIFIEKEGTQKLPKFLRPKGIVEKIKGETKAEKFNIYYHTQIWKILKAKEIPSYGHQLTESKNDWVWYEKWEKLVKEIVLRYFKGKKNQTVDFHLKPDQEKRLKDLGKKYKKV